MNASLEPPEINNSQDATEASKEQKPITLWVSVWLKRLVVYPLAVIISILLIVLLVLALLITRESSSEWLLKQLNQVPSLNITWKNFSGNLWQGILLEECQVFVVADKTTLEATTVRPKPNTADLIAMDVGLAGSKQVQLHIAMDKLKTHWRWSDIIQKKLMIHQVLVEHLVINDFSPQEKHPDTTDTPISDWPNISLPIQLVVDEVQLKKGLYINNVALPLFNRFKLSAAWHKEKAIIHSLELHHDLGQLTLSGKAETQAPYPMAIKLSGQGMIPLNLIDETAAKGLSIPIDTILTLSGNRDHVTLSFGSQPPMAMQLTGDIQTGLSSQKIQWEAEQAKAGVNVSWQRIAWPPQPRSATTKPQERWLESTGELSIKGGIEQFIAQLHASIDSDRFPQQQLALNLEGNPTAIQLSQLQIKGESGTVEGQARLDWSNTIALDSRVTLHDANLSPFLADWPSNISGGLVLTANNHTPLKTKDWPDLLSAVQTIPAWEVAVDFDNLKGDIRRYPFSLAGKASLDAQHKIAIKDFNLQQGSNQFALDLETELPAFPINLSQLYLPKTNVRWAFQGNDLKAILPDLSGQFAMTGNLQLVSERVWDFSRPKAFLSEKGIKDLEKTLDFSGAITASEFRYLDNTAQRVNIDWGIGTLHRREPSNNPKKTLINAKLRDVAFASGQLSEADVEITGRLTQHRLAAHAVTDLAGWMALDQNTSAITPAKPEAVQTNKENIQNSLMALSLRLNQSIKGDQWRGNILPINLTQVQPLLPQYTALSGKLSGDWQASLAHPGDFNSVIQLQDAQFNLLQSEQWSGQRFDMKSLRLTAKKVRQTLEGQVQGTLLGDGHLSGQVSIEQPQYSSNRPAPTKPESNPWQLAQLQGRIHLALPSLAWVDPFVDAAQGLDGQLDTQLTFAGTLEQPDVFGKIALKDAQVSIPDTGVDFQKSYVTLERSDQHAPIWRLSGGSQATRGKLDLSGELDVSRLPQWQGELRLKGDHFSALNLPDMQMDISPDLQILANPTRISVSGQIPVDQAEIVVHTVPAGSVQPSNDEVILDQVLPEKLPELAVDEEPIALHSDVRLTLSDQVYFSGFGLTGRLTGKLAVKTQPEKPIEAIGQLRIREGIYESYGQNLSIDRGLLIFQGPVDSPRVDIRASRRINDEENTLVGMQINGVPSALSTTLFSEPHRPEEDILSLLLTGRTFSVEENNSEETNAMLLNAVASLGIAQGGGLVRQLQNSTGLDVLSLDTGEGLDNSSVTVGKYITPELFISYVRSLQSPNASVQMEYRLTPKLKVQAASGDEQSVDVLYEFNSRK